MADLALNYQKSHRLIQGFINDVAEAMIDGDINKAENKCAVALKTIQALRVMGTHNLAVIPESSFRSPNPIFMSDGEITNELHLHTNEPTPKQIERCKDLDKEMSKRAKDIMK